MEKAGEVQEWLNWPLSKSGIAQAIEGSNPSLSAKTRTSYGAFFRAIGIGASPPASLENMVTVRQLLYSRARMEHISFSQRESHKHSNECTAHEYSSPTDALDAAVIDLNGRYPEDGFALNRECRALLYVVAKRGRVLSPESTGKDPIEVSQGSQVYIAPGEAYALEGHMQLLYVSTPKWSPDQAERITE